MRHLNIATPLYDGFVSLGYSQSLMRTLVACTKAGIGLTTDYKPGPYIHKNRNWLVHRFMQSDAEAILFIDADVTWDAEAVVRLFDWGLPVCGGAYPMKQELEEYPTKLLPRIDNGMIEAQWLPGGFLMIRRDVFTTMKPHVEHFIDPSSNGESVAAYFQNVIYPGQQEAGEDVEFCNRWRALGGKVWCWPNIDFEHSGYKSWAGNLSTHLAA